MSRPQPDWKTNLLQRYQRKGNPRLGPLQVKVSLPFVNLMDEAAHRLGITRATFIRRSVAVQIAHVLGRDLGMLLRQCPSSKPYGTNGGNFANDTFDTGDGIHEFCTHPGCDGRHLMVRDYSQD